MSNYIELKTKKLGEGVCQKCGNTYNELNFTTLISSNKTKSYVLCNECLLQLQIKTDNYNAEHQANNTEEKPYESIVRDEVNTQTENSVQNTNTNDTPKSNNSHKKPVRKLKSIISIVIAAVIVISGCSTAFILYSKNKPNTISFSELANQLISDEGEDNLYKKYNKKRFYFSFVPPDDYWFFTDPFEGQLFDSFGNEWLDPSSSYRCTWHVHDGKIGGQLEPGKKYSITAKLVLGGPSILHSTTDITERRFMLTDVKVVDSSDTNKVLDKKSKNFAIEGKWKNIGDTSCAQMQAGSITSFDGTHCNVYSPSDTYAFYESNGVYHLDCTSFFAGDSMNFIVRVIDNDNIELIYSEDTIVKLQRVG